MCVCETERERGGRKRLNQLSSEKKSGTFQRQKIAMLKKIFDVMCDMLNQK